jgi:geranylgeranyl pyrophosphate synthase
VSPRTLARRAVRTDVAPPIDPADLRVIAALGYARDVELLREHILAWIDEASEEMQPQLRWQFLGRSKYFRPLTVFACHRAISGEDVAAALVRRAMAVELFHNVSLIIDDILDASTHRRGIPTLHRRFGSLRALMASGYVVACGFNLLSDDPLGVRLLSELLSRLGVAECLQWRLRRQPLGVEDWRLIAGEDTGTMFEICACIGTRDERLRKFGRLLGMVYHGCDDVGDARGLAALGGGGDEDVRDGILTLPAAFAIRDSRIQRLFCKDKRTPAELNEIARAIQRRVPEAEAYLDEIAREAREEAVLRARYPDPLLALVDYTRQLSRR